MEMDLALSVAEQRKGSGSVWESVILNSLLSQLGDILWDQMLHGLATLSSLGLFREVLKSGIITEACV